MDGLKIRLSEAVGEISCRIERIDVPAVASGRRNIVAIPKAVLVVVRHKPAFKVPEFDRAGGRPPNSVPRGRKRAFRERIGEPGISVTNRRKSALKGNKGPFWPYARSEERRVGEKW